MHTVTCVIPYCATSDALEYYRSILAYRQVSAQRRKMADGPGAGDIPGWRVSLLLLIFVAVTFVLEHALEWIEHRLKHRKVYATQM